MKAVSMLGLILIQCLILLLFYFISTLIYWKQLLIKLLDFEINAVN